MNRTTRSLWLTITFACLMSFFILLPQTTTAAATQIMLDNQPIEGAGDVMITNQTTMVPIRVISEKLGYNVKWKKSDQQVTISNPSATIKLTVGQSNADSTRGNVVLEQSPFMKSNTTYVPLRFVGTEMGLKVKWDNTSKTVHLEKVTAGPDTNNGVTPDPSSTTIEGISYSDNRLMISSSAKVNPVDSVLTNPNRIVIDLPKTSFGAGFLQGTELKQGEVGTIPVTGSADVKQIRYSIFSSQPSQVRVVIDLNQSKSYKLYQQNDLTFVDLNTTATTKPVGSGGKKVVIIDPGHGDTDSGGIGATGVLEKNVVLNVGNKVAALLKKESQIDLIMTRTDDTFIPLDSRVKIAEDANADVFLSIHGNAAPNKDASGTETFYADTKRSKLLSDIIQKHVLAATGFKDRNSKQANYLVIRKTTMPAALLEIGFLTNKTEESIMVQDDFQNKVAQAIVAGLKEYLNIK